MRMVLRNVQSKKRSAGLLNIDSIVRKEIQSVMNDAKKSILRDMEKIVADWDSDVGFQARNIIKPNYIAINVFPTGKDKKVWGWVNDGTSPHTIRAKNSPYLKFRSGYQPKTAAKPARYNLSGGGQATGQWNKKVSVQHPGSQPRNFEEAIGKDYQPEFRRIAENAFRRAARKINK